MDADDVEWPQCEVVMDMMVGTVAQLVRLEPAEQSPLRRARYAKARELILRGRLRWNPNNQLEMDRLMHRFDLLGRRLQGRAERQRATGRAGT